MAEPNITHDRCTMGCSQNGINHTVTAVSRLPFRIQTTHNNKMSPTQNRGHFQNFGIPTEAWI